jgi:hypothetical protein
LNGDITRRSSFKPIKKIITEAPIKYCNSGVTENEIKYEGDAGSLSREIAITQIAKQKSSELHKILSKIAKVNAIDDVSIFVSDCILSFPDSDIAKNREINKQEAPNALKNNIYTTFSELKNKGLATSVYAFNSKFYGTYYITIAKVGYKNITIKTLILVINML